MRYLFLILLVVTVFSGCAIKPKQAMQTATGLEISVSKDTKKSFRLIDRNNRVAGKSTVKNKKLVFSLPAHISPDTCYAVIDDEGKSLLEDNMGIKITSIYDYNQKLRERDRRMQEHNRCLQNQNPYVNRLKSANINLNQNKLFNGSTCDRHYNEQFLPFLTRFAAATDNANN